MESVSEFHDELAIEETQGHFLDAKNTSIISILPQKQVHDEGSRRSGIREVERKHGRTGIETSFVKAALIPLSPIIFLEKSEEDLVSRFCLLPTSHLRHGIF